MVNHSILLRVECPELVEGQKAIVKYLAMAFVYMIHDKNNRLYIGVSDNPERRLFDHNHNTGADFTNQGGFKIVFLEEYSDFKSARTREIQLKKWRRNKKELLIDRYSKGLPTKQ